jgi:hypothetical protein
MAEGYWSHKFILDFILFFHILLNILQSVLNLIFWGVLLCLIKLCLHHMHIDLFVNQLIIYGITNWKYPSFYDFLKY